MNPRARQNVIKTLLAEPTLTVLTADGLKPPMKDHNYSPRLHAFDGPIADIAPNNPSIYRIITMFAAGTIITREEALSQMVVALAHDWDLEKRKAVELYQSSPPWASPK